MKTFVLDTNVLLHFPKAFQVFDDNEVIIPISVLDELDNAKVRPDELGRNARSAIRMLDELREKGSLSEGVKLNKSIIRVELNHQDNTPKGLSAEKKDHRLLSVAVGFKKDGKNVIVVTKDINLRVKCDALGLKSQDYIKDKLAEDSESIYSGTKTLEVDSGIINSLYKDGFISLEEEAFPNQFLLLKSGSQSAITCYKNERFELCKVPKELWGINPKNVEQKMALSLLLDPDIKLVTLIGNSGTGKTLMAVCSALHHVITDTKHFNRILLSRPIQPMGRDIGYLPGSTEEKLAPWMQPLYDNLEFLLGGDQQMINEYKFNGLLQIEPLTYIRGRSLPKSFMILDEAQNNSIHEIKTIITRMGDGSKIVITGDINQIDTPYLDFADNGLTHVVEKFKNHSIAGHITLKKGERSELATLASKIL